MPDIRFRCLACKSKLTVDSRGAGKTIACPRCGAPATVPQKSTVPPRVTPAGAADAPEGLQKEIAEVRFAAAKELENTRKEFLGQLKALEGERDRLKNELKTKSLAVDNITSALKNERELREQQERSIAERQGKLQTELKEKDDALRRAEEQQGRRAEASDHEREKWKQEALAEVESAREKLNEELRKKETMLRNERQTRKKLEEEHVVALESLRTSSEKERGRFEKERSESAAELQRLASEAEGLRDKVATGEAELVQVKESLAARDLDGEAERQRIRDETEQERDAVRERMMEEAAQNQAEFEAALRDATSSADQQLEDLRTSLRESTHALDAERTERAALMEEAAQNQADFEAALRDATSSADQQLEDLRTLLRESTHALDAERTERAALMEEAAQKQAQVDAALQEAKASANQRLVELRESLEKSACALDAERTARTADADRFKKECEEHRAALERRDAEIAHASESNASLERRFQEERDQDSVKQEHAESELRQAHGRAEEELKALRESLRDTAQSLVDEQANRKALEERIKSDIAKRDGASAVEPRAAPQSADTPVSAAAPGTTKRSESPAGDRAPQATTLGIAAGWLCLIAGIVMMVLSPWQTWMYGTALAVAMMIGLIVLSRRRSPTVYGLIGMCLLAPGILYVGTAVAGFEGLLPKREQAAKDPAIEEPQVEPDTQSPAPAASSEIGVGESFTVDKVRVTFTGVRTGPVTIRDVLGNQNSPEQPFLIVDVTLEAIDPELTIHVKQPWEMTRLIDENDTSLYVVPEQRLSLDHIEGTLRSARLVPGRRFADMLVFELPDEESAEFRVISDPGIYRTAPGGLHEPVSSDILRLRFSREDITRGQAA